MPRVAYLAVVGVENIDNESTAIAEASRYLAYADQTDSFGYHGRIYNVSVTKRVTDTDPTEIGYAVRLRFTTVVGLQEDKDAIEKELDRLARVESWDEVPAPTQE